MISTSYYKIEGYASERRTQVSYAIALRCESRAAIIYYRIGHFIIHLSSFAHDMPFDGPRPVISDLDQVTADNPG
jgi:hypothetical protein